MYNFHVRNPNTIPQQMQPDFITSLEKLNLQDCLVLIGVLTNRSLSLISKETKISEVKAITKPKVITL